MCVSTSPYQYKETCSWLLQLLICIPLAAATTAACLNFSLEKLGVLLKIPSALQPLQTPTVHDKYHTLLILWTPAAWANEISWRPTWPSTWCPAPVDLRAQYPACTSGEGHFLLRSVHKFWKRLLVLQMYRHLCKATGIKKNQENMNSPKRHSKPPATDPQINGDTRIARQIIQNHFYKDAQRATREHK